MMFAPYISFDQADGRDEINDLLVKWEHKLGPINRPEYTSPIDFIVRRHGEPVALITADTLIKPTCDLTRETAFELSRLCGPEYGMCSLAMKLWRQFGYPVIAAAWKTPWVISYQDAARHKGTLYRYDHWLVLGHSTGGMDKRANAATINVRRRVIWGWNADASAMADRRGIDLKTPAWALEAA